MIIVIVVIMMEDGIADLVTRALEYSVRKGKNFKKGGGE